MLLPAIGLGFAVLLAALLLRLQRGRMNRVEAVLIAHEGERASVGWTIPSSYTAAIVELDGIIGRVRSADRAVEFEVLGIEAPDEFTREALRVKVGDWLALQRIAWIRFAGEPKHEF